MKYVKNNYCYKIIKNLKQIKKSQMKCNEQKLLEIKFK